MKYRKDIDSLKGLAIIAVILFHMGLLKSGYLGVDLFFVINGFLVVPSLCNKISQSDICTFSYFDFIARKVFRLLPLIVLASIVCLCVGYIGMLPDNFENLAETVIASNVFSENILAWFTTKDYWKVVNDYKPLMHLWYVGILAEFYIIVPLILIVIKKIAVTCGHCVKKSLLITLVSLFILSLILFIIPQIPFTDKFYLIPFRLFELIAGGLVGLTYEINYYSSRRLSGLWLFFLIVVIFISVFTFDIDTIGSNEAPLGQMAYQRRNELILPKTLLLLLVVTFSCLVLLPRKIHGKVFNFLLDNNILANIGKMSYSIFIWHQIILAFYRCFASNQITIPFIFFYLLAVGILSWISYTYIEQKLRYNKQSFIILISSAVLILFFGGCIYVKAGVVRDVPELSITKNDAHRNMHAEYCDRIYEYNKDFDDDNRIKVLLVGNSFARDMANVLLESKYKDTIDISYCIEWNGVATTRASNSDLIFTFFHPEELPDNIMTELNQQKIFGIGTKNYGQCNEIVYTKRYKDDYFETTLPANPDYVELNNILSEKWGDHYIDFYKIATASNGEIKVFTPDHFFISQDCRHLTQAGAKWYANVLDLDRIFKSMF